MEEQFYSIALTMIPGLGTVGIRQLLDNVGSATEVFKHRKELSSMFPMVSKKLTDALDNPEALRRAEEEQKFMEKNQIRCLTLNGEDYPSRLRECDDAPIVLYYKGSADLNALKVVAMVGTRRATSYGKDICSRFLHELKELASETLVVSGLAYGIDICAHRAALEYGYDTIGVLAHGLDRLYPSQHRETAARMLRHGGLLTEFAQGTNPDPFNFVRRNRIVAGMSDATIVVESASKGGALITAELAGSYHRECFAFPGRIGDEYSMGCNNLIKQNQAALITSAEDFVMAMGWDKKEPKPKAIQRELFPELNEEETLIVNLLEKHPDGMQINTLVVESNIPVHKISMLLFELEMKGVIRTLAGGVYKLVN